MTVGAPRVFVTDFGLAKNVATGSKYTRSGETLGTPAYMSPEQARGELTELTSASDVWALGCVLYELLAGRPAFDGDTPAAVIGAVITSTPALHVGHPRPVTHLVSVCLQRSAANRYRSAGALADDFRRVLGGERPLARIPHGRRALWAALAVGVVVAGIGLTIRAVTRVPPPAVTSGQTTEAGAQRLAERGWELRHSDVAEARRLLAEALDRAPQRHEWRIRLGLMRWADGDDIESAVATWDSVPRASSRWTRARWFAGLAWQARFLDERDPAMLTKVETAWESASGGRAAEAGWARAGLLLVSGRPIEARSALGVPSDWSAWLLRAIIETQISLLHVQPTDVPAGIDAYSRALRQGVTLAWAHVNRGILRAEQGDLVGAVVDMEAALRCRPGYANAYVGRGAMRAQLGDAAGARADFDAALRSDPDDADAYFNRGILRSSQGDAAGARADCDAALRCWPGHARALVSRGRLRLADKDYAGARADLDEAIKRKPNLVDAYFSRGRLRKRLGDVDGALADYDAVLRLRQDDPDAHVNRGALRVARGDTDGARADYDAALRAQPDCVEAYVNRGVLRGRLGDPAGARSDYDAALRYQPDYAEALYNRGALRMSTGDLAGAVADLDAALRSEPDLASAYGALGHVRMQQQDWRAATVAFDRFLQLAPPTHPMARRAHGWIAHCQAQLRAQEAAGKR